MAALKIFSEEKFENQISDQSFFSLIDDIGKIQTDLVLIVKPGKQIRPDFEMFVPDLQYEFVKDPKLGIGHGQEGGHTLIKTNFLCEVIRNSAKEITSYASLVKAFRRKGLKVKRFTWIHVD